MHAPSTFREESMTLPKLVIAGSEREPTQYVKAAALNLGFQLVPSVRQSNAAAWVKCPAHLVIWLAPQLPLNTQTLKLAGNDRPHKKPSMFELHANVALFYPCDPDHREKQVDEFLREVQDGGIPSVAQGQAWRGFVMPSLPKMWDALPLRSLTA